MNPINGGPDKATTNKQQDVTSASQPENDPNEMRKEEEEKFTEEKTKQKPVHAMMQAHFMEIGMDILRRRTSAATGLEFLERRILAGLETDETLTPKADELTVQLEALIKDREKLRDLMQRHS
ncbi:hypothetical protein N7507_003266 [Penicillium longicatenatum]|nr:hypothetical protein N7507_003266 [Penicillium longicatenatum]